MVSTSKDLLKKVAMGVFRIHPDPKKVCDFGPEKRLSQMEINFYEAHKSIKKILTNLKDKIDAAGPFKLFPDDFLSDQQKTGINYVTFVVAI